jgi:hypothetical protein
MRWFTIGELRRAIDEVETRYPNAELSKNQVGNLTFSSGAADDDPQVGHIDLLDCSVAFWGDVTDSSGVALTDRGEG